MPVKNPVTLKELAAYPQMARWFNPILLLKLLRNVIVSTMFGQYADRRLIVAALDTVPKEELLDRATVHTRLPEGKPVLAPDEEGAVWIDFVADLGDGFDATFAVASLLAKETIEVNDHVTRRGQILVMGGDEVYPLASGKAYQEQLRDPYGWASPDPNPTLPEGVPVYCIPGNHDWYDGLVVFLALFSRKEPLHLGSWRSAQRRSYFAVKLTDNWWIWCLDTQLDDDMDQPQKDYFIQIAQGMPADSKIILCGPEPGWLYTEKTTKSLDILDYAINLARSVHKHLKIPIVLSGDTHHYSRYYADAYGAHFITSGGGGAFLHPTHQLKTEVEIKWFGKPTKLSLCTDPGPGHAPTDELACYPSQEASMKLLNGDLFFWLKNWEFSLLFGVIYWVFSMALTARGEIDAYIITFLCLAGGILGYFVFQEGRRKPVVISSLIHATAHYVALVGLTLGFGWFNRDILGLQGMWTWAFALALEVIPTGGFFGGLFFGLNLLITCRWFNMNHNDAFSAMRLDSFRHFLRIRIKGDEVKIFPIGIDDVPRRQDWRVNEKWKEGDPSQPAYVPARPLVPKLIEDPLVVEA